MRRAERQKVRLLRPGGRPRPTNLDDEGSLPTRRQNTEKVDNVTAILQLPELAKPRNRLPWTWLSFLAVVIVPTVLASLYYAFIASPQYMVESQFAVRGSTQNSLSALGLSIVGSSAPHASDSYVVADYIQSAQILLDIKERVGLDVRSLYTRPDIDFLYREDADKSLDEFRDYWRSMINVSFNSTTGNVTLRVFAFTSTDARAISDAILKVSEDLVNSLSEKSRQQLIGVATEQVSLSEDRLRNVRSQMTELRRTEQAVDPAAIASMESAIISGLEQQLAGLRTRYKALLDTLDPDAPSARVIERQIVALETQLGEQRNRLSGGSGGENASSEKTSRSAGVLSALPDMIARFSELTVEEEFATKAYTMSLAALEAAIQEARKQELYFGVYVTPRTPEVALYPLSLLNTGIVLLAAFCVWVIGYFGFRSIREHAI